MRYLTLFISFLILTACNKQKIDTRKLIAQWQGKEILFPSGLEAKLNGRDTIWTEWQQPGYKILNYIDTTGCTECQLRLFDWEMLKQEAQQDSLPVTFVFITYVKDFKRLGVLQKINRFSTPFLYDHKGSMDSLNHFPKNNFFKTFLLDQDNKVVLVGNPLNRAALWKLYKQRIQEGAKP